MGSYALQSGEYEEDGELETLDEDEDTVEVEDTSDDNDELSDDDDDEEEEDSEETYEHPGRHPFPAALERWTTGSVLLAPVFAGGCLSALCPGCWPSLLLLLPPSSRSLVPGPGSSSRSSLELETKVHRKVRNHGEGPY